MVSVDPIPIPKLGPNVTLLRDDDPQALPKEISRRQGLRDQLDAARRRLEAAAKARAEAERDAYEAKVAARNMRKSCFK